MLAQSLTLALAAAVVDVTVGYPSALARRVGSPSVWAAAWFQLVGRAMTGAPGALVLVLYLAPILVSAAAIAEALPDGPLGFAVAAILASTFSGRQTLDALARRAARVWAEGGDRAGLAAAEALQAHEGEWRPGVAIADAVAARFAEDICAPTLFLALGGLPGGALAVALVAAGRVRAEAPAPPRAAALALGPGQRLAAFWLRSAAALFARGSAARLGDEPDLKPAERAMRDALQTRREDAPDYARRALGAYRRAAALEMLALATLTAIALLWKAAAPL